VPPNGGGGKQATSEERTRLIAYAKLASCAEFTLENTIFQVNAAAFSKGKFFRDNL
jgi:hypothetical protein